MLRSMYTSITGLKNHQTMLDVVGNNIANVNTFGFKASTTTFKDLLSQTLQGASSPNATIGGTNARQIGLGMQLDAVTQKHIQGALATTGNKTDLGISGDGFFRVTNNAAGLATVPPSQPTFYARAGNFSLDASGNLVTQDGYFVIGHPEAFAGGPPPVATGTPDMNLQQVITIPPGTTQDWSIGADGRVSYIDNTGTLQTAGWISMAKFANPAGLQSAGSNKWVASQNSGTENIGIAKSNYGPGLPLPGVPTDMTNTELVSGSLEMSNVDLATEFTDMIRAQRGFQANSRVITTSDEILQELVNLKR